MTDNSELIPIDICIAIEHGKAKLQEIEQTELAFKKAMQDLAEQRNEKYREIVREQIPELLKPYVHLEEITWPFSDSPKGIQQSQMIRIKINGLPEFIMEWDSVDKEWIAFLNEHEFGTIRVNSAYENNYNDVEIFLARLHEQMIRNTENDIDL